MKFEGITSSQIIDASCIAIKPYFRSMRSAYKNPCRTAMLRFGFESVVYGELSKRPRIFTPWSVCKLDISENIGTFCRHSAEIKNVLKQGNPTKTLIAIAVEIAKRSKL
jgi:hypothetical protein